MCGVCVCGDSSYVCGVCACGVRCAVCGECVCERERERVLGCVHVACTCISACKGRVDGCVTVPL